MSILKKIAFVPASVLGAALLMTGCDTGTEAPKNTQIKDKPIDTSFMKAAAPGTKKGTEAPKAEAPKAEAPKAEAPKAEAPKADEAPKAETPK